MQGLKLFHVSAETLQSHSALLTSAADLICLIIFAWMYREDARQRAAARAGGAAQAGQTVQAAGLTPAAASPRHARLLCLLAPLAGACFCALFSLLFDKLGFYRMFSNEVQENLLAAPAWVQIIGLGIVVPAAEELCYRGLIYERVSPLCGRTVACVIVSVLFAVGHGNLIQFAYALPMALIITLFYEGAGRNIAAAMLFHAGANLLTVAGNLGILPWQ